ncbi:alpha/beta fold hydrolase [Cellulomonas dongxiuzhuiae]|uniref:alpha/beta fold hydrolase n=1 Tax=Cellulomonas dongxiuzhuiae TaxID=2819979 RepID=UPI001AAE306A|nr:alpha/beta hydrolase [Cellulomonas dongxiuzhuiae]MBO3089962.1 alpha/beta hydrolase [Cellulomonas dongxiuzhuiae]
MTPASRIAFAGADGTGLVAHLTGAGEPPVCVPGGPMQASAYLGDLGGLASRRSLLLLDLRGTGGSEAPADPGTYRCDRQVDDLEALRRHRGVDRLDLLAHSAGAALAVLYAARYPERVRSLVLVTPSPRVVGVAVADADRRAVAERRRDEPWYPTAWAAFGRIWTGEATPADADAIMPFLHGRWDDERRAQLPVLDAGRNDAAAAAYYPEDLDVDGTRAGLAAVRAPVLLLAGELDVALPPERAADYAALFPLATLAVQPGAGHYPWLDDPDGFVRAVSAYLDDRDRAVPEGG